MNISGYTVLIDKGRWVEEDRLANRSFFAQFKERVERFLANPDIPLYIQGGKIAHLKRIRMMDGNADIRIYLKPYHQTKLLCILACLSRSHIKRDERSGALDIDFTKYLERHIDFLPDRFVELQPPKEKQFIERVKAAPLPQPPPPPSEPIPADTEPEAPSFATAFYLTWPLEEAEAMAMILSTMGHRPYIAEILLKIQSAPEGDRILVPLPENSFNMEKAEIQDLQREISFKVKAAGFRYSVRFDPFARKFLLVPPEKLKIHCYGKALNGRPSYQSSGVPARA